MSSTTTPNITIQIPFTSFDKSKNAHVYAIRLTTTTTINNNNNKPLPILTKRRFREFVALRENLLQESNTINELSLPHLPSKVFSTDPELRKPKLEAWLNAVIQICIMAQNNKSLPTSLLTFLNVNSMNELEKLLDTNHSQPKQQHQHKKTTTWLQFATSDPTLLLVYALSLTLLTGFLLVSTKNTTITGSLVLILPFISSMLLCAAAVRIVTYSLSSSSSPPTITQPTIIETEQQLPTDHSILSSELPLLEDLRERLSDFVDVEVSREFDETWLKNNKAVVNEWTGGEQAARNGLTSLEKRTFIWTQYGLVDRRLIQFIRSNHGNLVLAELEAREAFTARLALRMDWIHEYFTPPKWLTDYGSCPRLEQYINNRQGRIDNFWVRDRDGCLAIFNRAGPINSLAVAEKLKYNDPLLIQSFLWYVELLRLDFDQVHDQTHGDCPASVTLFSDMDGFALSEQLGSTTVLRIAQKYVPILSKTYNGVLKRVVVFNAPWFVNMLFAIIKPFIPAHILACISIHGKLNPETHLLPFIDKKYIPKMYGGEMVGENGDETCRDRLPPVGPWLEDKGRSLLIVD
jgi:hypothetical protein